MDPKQNGNQPLDPKLQEVYDRVMGTNLSGGAAPTPPAPATPAQPTPTDPTSTPMPPAAPATDPGLPSTPAEPSLPPMPPIDIPGSSTADPTAPIINPVTPPTDPALNPTTESVQPPVNPGMPSLPQTDSSQSNMMPQETMSAESIPSATLPTDDAMSATMSIPQVAHHDSETVKIGNGGSPVAATIKTKGKGLSPMILIFGAFAFLAVYAVFWVKFFGYSLPFLPK